MEELLDKNSKKSKILIVEDNESNLFALSMILKSCGYIIIEARTGYQGVELSVSESPDLILMDINMPGISGFQTTERIKANPETSAIPIMFTTALHDLDDVIRAFEIGAVDYITKPIRNAELIARINTHLELKKIKELNQELTLEIQLSDTRANELTNNLKAANLKIKELTTELEKSKRRMNLTFNNQIATKKASL